MFINHRLRTAHLPTELSQALAHECMSPDPSTHESTSQAIYNCIAPTHRSTESLICAQPYPMSIFIVPLIHTEHFHDTYYTDTPIKGPARGLSQQISR